MKKKRGVHRLAHRIVAAKRKGNIAHATAYTRSRKILFYPTCCLDEIDRVIAMLIQAGRDGQNVGIKDDIIGRNIRVFGKEIVSPCADVGFSLKRVGLAALIKSHHDDGCAVAPNQSRLPEKFLFTVLQTDGIDDGFA